MKNLRILGVMIVLILIAQIIIPCLTTISQAVTYDYTINLSDLSGITIYSTVEELEAAKINGNLPEGIYITTFLYDGVDAYKTYDLDDFAEEGNDMEVETLSKTVVNINTTGNIELTGTLKGGMIAVNTNGKTEEINLYLNGVNIDTKDDNDKGKKVPAIYVYNKDITYTACKVTIKTVESTENYIEGGKFKKVSLVGSDEYDSYSSNYSGTNATNYTTYSNYYKVYTSEQINNILFAKVQADNEDLADGDPYYFYKGAGAISSDIDLYFEGTGYLSVVSKNKEGIETKGNLEFAGGTGDYYIFAEDDCLNTTTSSSNNNNVRNALTINVKSLIAVVDSGEDADEGDAIDSNGTLTINGGTIIAIAHPGQDAGLDSEKGTYINGGTVLATGDMIDSISNQSTQNFLVFNFREQQEADSLITLLDSDDNVVMAYKADRTYKNLVFSSPDLTEGNYSLYKDGTIEGTITYTLSADDTTHGLYTSANVTNYEKGTEQGYSSSGEQGGMPNDGEQPGGQGQNTPPDGEAPEGTNPPDGGNMTPPSEQGDGNAPQRMEQEDESGASTNKEIKVSGISNQYNGVGDYVENGGDNTTAKNLLSNAGINGIGIIMIVLAIALVGTGAYAFVRNKRVMK